MLKHDLPAANSCVKGIAVFRATIGVMLSAFSLLPVPNATAGDWPMWRHDAARSAETEEQLPDRLTLLWTRELPKLKPAYRTRRLQFDAGYEPVAAGKRLFVGSSFNDSVTAYDTETGQELWRFYAEGPVRCAPVAWQDRVIFGADDGYVYCVAANDGQLIWKFQAAPTNRRVLGNGRLISLWPVRGGPVLENGKVYFTVGVWPFEGTFLYALDARTGKPVSATTGRRLR